MKTEKEILEKKEGEDKMKTVVVINEQHSLMPIQEKIIKERFGTEIEFNKIPDKGLNLEEIDQLSDDLIFKEDVNIVIVSPIPVLIAKLAYFFGEYNETIEVASKLKIKISGKTNSKAYMFYRDMRNKEETKDGKIINTIENEGWKLINISDDNIIS